MGFFVCFFWGGGVCFVLFLSLDGKGVLLLLFLTVWLLGFFLSLRNFVYNTHVQICNVHSPQDILDLIT